MQFGVIARIPLFEEGYSQPILSPADKAERNKRKIVCH